MKQKSKSLSILSILSYPLLAPTTPFPVFITPFAVDLFTSIEAPKVFKNTSINRPSQFLVFYCLTNFILDFIILITPISSFAALMNRFACSFLGILLSIAKANMIRAKTFLSNRAATFISRTAYIRTRAPRNLSGWMNLENCAFLSFISVEIILAKAFYILVSCLDINNNSCGNSLSWQFLFVILDAKQFLFFCSRF